MSKAEYMASAEEEDKSRLAPYAIILLKLQELCGMTYREARAHLMAYRETEDHFAKDMGITVQSARNICRRAAWKMECSGFDLYEIMERYGRLPVIDI